MDFEFPFFGAGIHHPFEYTSLFVAFAKSPKPPQKEAIAAIAPPPFENALAFSGSHLVVAPDDYIHLLVSMHYDADPGDEDDLEGRPIFAADSRWRRYHEDVERWLRQVHEIAPIVAAVQPQDGEGGDTDLSPWHHWSVQQLDGVLERYEKVLAKPKGRAKPAVFLAVLLELLEETGVSVPARFVRWHEPEIAVRQAILSADSKRLQAEFDALDPEDRQEIVKVALKGIGLECSDERQAVLAQEAILLDVGEYGWGALVAAATLEAEEPVTDKRLSRLLEASPEHEPASGISYGASGRRPIEHRLKEVGALRFPEDDYMLGTYFTAVASAGGVMSAELVERALTRADNYLLVICMTSACYNSGEFERGVAMVDAADATGTMKDSALLNAGLLLAASGDAERARDFARRAAEYGDPAACMLEPAALVAEGKLDEAVERLVEIKASGQRLYAWREDHVFAPLASRPDFLALFA